ncbi:MAG: transposase [Planctomycetota bacterium]
METCRSPRTVMRVAHDLAARVLPDYTSRFSRHDFTLPQLFACLVVREQLRLSYRKAEAVLRDTDWCKSIGMWWTPDHTTLCRAFGRIANDASIRPLFDGCVGFIENGRSLAIDSTQFDIRHRSRHYEWRCRRHAAGHGNAANTRRSATARGIPKLAVGIEASTHLIASALGKTGMGSDAPDFAPLLTEACSRGRWRRVLADAGYDSKANHHLARDRLGVCSWIKTGVGRPSEKPAADLYRRKMQRQLRGSQAGRPYAQRAQAETVMSMLKRNLGDCLRARTTHRREMEMLLKVITHNIMIIRRQPRVATEPSRPLLFTLFSDILSKTDRALSGNIQYLHFGVGCSFIH